MSPPSRIRFWLPLLIAAGTITLAQHLERARGLRVVVPLVNGLAVHFALEARSQSKPDPFPSP